MVRYRHLIAVVVVFVIWGAVLLAVGCAGVRSGAPEEQGHTEAAEEQARSPEARASEEGRCAGTRTFDHVGAFEGRMYRGTYTTNDVSGCPDGGLLSGTDKPDELAGGDGEDEVHGLGAGDEILGGLGSDVIYGGPGDDRLLYGDGGDDVIRGGDDALYGGDGEDELLGGKGEDVLYGGDGNDWLDGSDFWPAKQRDKLYCGEGIDHYVADKLDRASSSCEKKIREGPPVP
jgi:hypothetical protein